MIIKNSVFDVDDIMWGLNAKVSKKLGTDLSLYENFSIHKCNKLSKELQDEIINAYHNPSIFDNIEFYEGVEDLLILEEYGIKVSICSNCMSQSIADKKTEQLLSKIHGLRKEQINMHVIDVKDHNKKNLIFNIWCLSDDSPYNIAKSDAKYNLTLPYPWNQSNCAKEIMKEKEVITLPTFNDILNFQIKMITQEKAS